MKDDVFNIEEHGSTLIRTRVMAKAYLSGIIAIKMSKGFTEAQSRDSANEWLSKKMKIEKRFVNIETMDVEQCRQVIILCEPYLKNKK